MTTTDSPSALSAVEAKLFVPADDSQWEAFAGRYRALLDAPLDAAGVPDWLTGWNAVGSAVTDVAARLSTHADLHTDRPDIQERYQTFVAQVLPQVERAEQALKEKLLGVPDFMPAPDFALNFRRMRDAAALYREANVTLGVTHEARHLGKRRIGANACGLHHEPTSQVHRRARHVGPDRYIYRNAFTCEHRNIKRRTAFSNYAVCGDDLPWSHDEQIADLHLGCINQHLFAIAQNSCMPRTQRQQRTKCVTCPAFGPSLEVATSQQKTGDGYCDL